MLQHDKRTPVNAVISRLVPMHQEVLERITSRRDVGEGPLDYLHFAR